MGFTAFAIIITAVALEVFGQLAFKRGAMRAGAHDEAAARYWLRMLRDGWVQAGIALHVLELLLWLAALRLAPLSVAFPLMALSYCGTAVAGHYWLGERLGHRARVAIAMITAGAALVSWTAG